MRLRCILACLVWIQRLAIGTIASATTPAKGVTRCFCNEASCVRTGYMCKSLLDACFSLLSPDGHGFRSTHGCADSLPEPNRGACANGSHVTIEKEVLLSDDGQTQRQRLFCCRQDMCNYMDGSNVVLLSAISNNNNNNNNNNNGSSTKSSPADSVANQSDASWRELWFRVAVIAVPMIGLFILILLVGAAVRMLRGDARRHQVCYDRTDVMAAEMYKQLIHNSRHSTRSQGIRICDGFCSKRDVYPTCWVDFSDNNTRMCGAHTACVLAGSNGVKINPVEDGRTLISVEKPGDETRLKEQPAVLVRSSSQVHFPIATV